MATKVKLRDKRISKGRKSLYLDFYPPIPHPKTGESTRREFFGIYIYLDKKEQKQDIKDLKEKIDLQKKKGENTDSNQKKLNEYLEYFKTFKGLSSSTKIENAQNIKIAEGIKQKRQNILNKPEIYNDFEKEQLRVKELGKGCFVEYVRKLANKKYDSNRSNWNSALKFLETYTNGTIKFSELNVPFFEGFKDYLKTTNSLKNKKSKLSNNSASSYFNKIKIALKQAQIEDIVLKDLNSKIKPIKEEETTREFLYIDEINKLKETPFENNLLRVASFFSILTGMAFKEIQNLTWGDISFNEERGHLILTKRSKTKRNNYLPISNEAYNLLGKSKEPHLRVFENLKYSAYENKGLQKWVTRAGINKKITFHCFRHTFATTQLFKGTDLYTVSKLLGHKNIQTTQIYAKIVDETKREAVNRVKLNTNNESL
ncbi:tyrosine-type recombinase/integrase [Tenacibaculum aiptasiae]|uniref:tyrosine-type recombinase/integrase n=1 Tax=Tenacibaculum aiptasiae TaxID=426481 RepID=UPI00232D36AD|nr:site-specific integrase [Tenacibaculum aiptasiae]